MKKKLFIILAFFFLLFLIVFIYKVMQFEAKLSSFATSNGTLAYYTRGNGDPIILLPGFGMTMHDWDPLFIEKLSQNNKLIMLDYRGVGNSTGLVSDITEGEMADDILTVMDGLKIKKAHILGWSLGSFVAQVIAEKYPSRVDKLILVATGPGGGKSVGASDSINKAIQGNLGGSWEDVYVPYLFYSQDNAQAYLKRLQTAEKNKTIPADTPEKVDAKLAHERAFANPVDEQKRYEGLTAIKNETLLITGEDDELLPTINADLVKKRILNAQEVIVPNAGHGVLFEKPEEMSKLITNFLN